MKFYLLTGATGFLGRFLLRDALAAGIPVAVLARGTRAATGRDRVDSALRFWERSTGRLLPRPVVLEGSLTEVGLGLSRDDRAWLAGHCRGVLHCAASIKFQAESPEDDPYRSNVGGTQALLAFCREAEIRRFHHVSTAYVCGTRMGRVLEGELEAGQSFGNDYERSKFESERLVRAADFLESPTFYRPSIIVGDSTTGYTSTFHGVYTPLRLMWERRLAGVFGGSCAELLGLRGDERKNVVPVDWVSAAIVHILRNPSLHGRTYHLTSPRGIAVGELERGFAPAFEDFDRGENVRREKSPAIPQDSAEVRRQMEVYRTYFRNDPEFDCSNTQAAAPHLPCPPLDPGRLALLARFALSSNFGWPPPPVHRTEWEIERRLASLLRTEPRQALPGPRPFRMQLDLVGPGGGGWTLVFSGGACVSADRGLEPGCEACVAGSAETFEGLFQGRRTLGQALLNGELVLEADRDLAATAVDLLSHLVRDGHEAGRSAADDARAISHNFVGRAMPVRA